MAARAKVRFHIVVITSRDEWDCRFSSNSDIASAVEQSIQPMHEAFIAIMSLHHS
jgi:hypothetical protein